MKKQIYMQVLIVLALLVGISTQSFAKKIKFGEYITYNGKVENDMPKGEGKLSIVNNSKVFKKAALFKGVFDGYIIEGTLDLFSEGYYPTFKGKAEIEIAKDASCVKVKAISGTLTARTKDGAYTDYMISANDKLVIACYPHTDKIYLLSKPFLGKRILSNTKETKLKPHKVSDPDLAFLGNDYRNNTELNVEKVKWYSCDSLLFDMDDDLTSVKHFESIEMQRSGSIITMHEDGTEEILYEDGDYLCFKNGTIPSFIRHLNGGTLSRKSENGKTIYKKDDGTTYVALQCWEDGNLRSILKERILSATTIGETSLTLFEGATGESAFKAFNGDPQGMYDLGMAFLDGKGVKKNKITGESFIRNSAKLGNPNAKDYLAKKEAAAAALAEKAEREKEEYMTAKGIQDGEYGDYLVEQFRLLDKGDMLGTLRVGICYELGCGLDKNITTAFKYYKMVSESDDEELQKMATFLMGLCYWKGEGTAKNQTLAFKCLSADFCWNVHEDRINLPWNIKKLFNDKERMGYCYYYIGKCYDQGIGTTKYIDKAIQYYSLSVQWYEKIADVWYMLGYYTEKGKNHSEYSYLYRRNTAKQYYREAANLGDKRAIQALNRL